MMGTAVGLIIRRLRMLADVERPFTPEGGSVRPQTLGKRVSDDPRHFIFRRPKIVFGKNFR